MHWKKLWLDTSKKKKNLGGYGYVIYKFLT